MRLDCWLPGLLLCDRGLLLDLRRLPALPEDGLGERCLVEDRGDRDRFSGERLAERRLWSDTDELLLEPLLLRRLFACVFDEALL